MKYPIECKNIVDVTKPPYNADNTGKVDCTKILCQVFDDIMIRELEGIQADKEKFLSYGEDFVYRGFENRYYFDNKLNIIYPEFVPNSRIIYFPAGTYLVSDTVSYTFKEFRNILDGKPFAELCRGIHVMGEGKDCVTIRLADNSKGFEKGSRKPVISFNTREEGCEREVTNIAQLNTMRDLSIDCGSGNEGAVGFKFCSNNSGRIEGLNIKANGGFSGIQFVVGSEAVVRNVNISGFDYGMWGFSHGPLAVCEIDVSGCKKAALCVGGGVMSCDKINLGGIDCFEFIDASGMYYVTDSSYSYSGEIFNNKIYVEEEIPVERFIPENVRSTDPSDWVCVDDFGAVGDGKTDSTRAIQRAMNSGKPIIVFGDGHYLINGKIKIPATVKTVDFMFCDLFSGGQLIGGEYQAAFDICEESEDILFLENLYTFEQFYGHMRCVMQSAKRDVVLSDFHNQASATYFNTRGAAGSKIYLDDVASTVGTYSGDCVLHREECVPAYNHMIPCEFHGVTVYGRQVNLERADIEMLNDNSRIMIDAYKSEGPGVAVRTIGGGVTYINTCSCGIGYKHIETALWETVDSKVKLRGIRVHGVNERLSYKIIIKQTMNGKTHMVFRDELEEISEFSSRINYYDCEDFKMNDFLNIE